MTEIWLNEGFAPIEGAIPGNDRGFLLADGVYDTSLVLNGKVFLRGHHLDRMVAAADTLNIPVERSHLETAIDALAERQQNGTIRLTLSRGPGHRGLTAPADPKPTLLGTTSPLNPDAMFTPMRLDVSSIRRNETSPSAQIKSLAYLDQVMANESARAAGASEALFLNTKDRLSCSALANVFLLTEDELLTPPLADGALDGTIRRWMIENAAEMGVAARDRPLHLDDVATGTLFLTNSLRLITPAWLTPAGEDRFDKRIPDAMRKLCAAIAEETGADPRELGAVLPQL